MTVKECYQILGNYKEAADRLGDDTQIIKYLKKFRTDSCFSRLCTSLEELDYQQAFVAVHSLKGLYLNLSMTKAAPPAVALCELLRQGPPREDITALADKVKRDYQEAIQTLDLLFSESTNE